MEVDPKRGLALGQPLAVLGEELGTLHWTLEHKDDYPNHYAIHVTKNGNSNHQAPTACV